MEEMAMKFCSFEQRQQEIVRSIERIQLAQHSEEPEEQPQNEMQPGTTEAITSGS